MSAEARTTSPNWAYKAASLLGIQFFWWAFNVYVFVIGGNAVIGLIPMVLAGVCIVSAVLLIRSKRGGFWLAIVAQIPLVLQGLASISSYAPLLGVMVMCLGLAGAALLLLGRTWKVAR